MRLLYVALTVLASCASAETEGSQTSGTTHRGAGGATASSSSSDGAGGGGGGPALRCDDMGFCGEADDPGCQGCALTKGSCADELEACKQAPRNSCIAFNQCLLECKDDDTACQLNCKKNYAGGYDAWDALWLCVFCQECPVSCAVPARDCM